MTKATKKISMIILGALIVGSIGAYLFEVNRIAAQGFQIRELENQIYSMQEENEKLSIQMVEMQSMSAVESRIENMAMIPVDNIAYYDSASPVVARK